MKEKEKVLFIVNWCLYLIYLILYYFLREIISQFAAFSLFPLILMSIISLKWGLFMAILNFPIHTGLRMLFGDTFLIAFREILIPFFAFLILSMVIGRFVNLNLENYQNLQQLKAKIQENKQLKSLLPICAKCKKIRDDKGYWNQLEDYLKEHSEITFSHGYCPDCTKDVINEIDEFKDS